MLNEAIRVTNSRPPPLLDPPPTASPLVTSALDPQHPILNHHYPCCIIGQQTNVVVSNENKQRCTYVHLKNLFLVDVVTLLYMDEVKWDVEESL